MTDKNFKGTPEEYIEFRRKRNEANKRYYSRPEVKAKRKIYCKNYRQVNKEKISEYGRELRSRPETKERIRKWKEENKDHLKEMSSKWREKNLERKRKMDRLYYRKLREDPNFLIMERQRRKEFKLKHPEAKRKYYLKYYNSEKGTLNWIRYNHKRMSLRHNCKFKIKPVQIKEIFDRDKRCVYCGEKEKLQLDHIIPLIRGGEGIFENFVVACQYCNSSKNHRDVFYWCNLQGIEVPKIVVELLDQQKAKALDLKSTT